jgi:heptosyltransferase-2
MPSNQGKALPDFTRILVRATNWVGDAVMSLPALQAIRSRFPRAHICVLARPWVADLYEREPFADQVILLTAGRGTKDLGGKWRVAQALREHRFDCAILLQNAFEAALITWLARIPRRIGYSRDGRGLLLTDPIRLPKPGEIPKHERFYYLELLRRAGILDGELPTDPIHFDRTQEVRAAGSRALLEVGLQPRTIGVSPGAAFGGAKRWPAPGFAEAAARLATELHCVVLESPALMGRKAHQSQQNPLSHAIRGGTSG